MTTLVINEDINLSKTSFNTVEDLYEALYEEILEQKMQYAKNNEKFTDF